MSENPQPFVECLERHAAERSGVDALGTVRGGCVEWLTWSEVQLKVCQRAEQLASHQLSPGDRVLVGGKNSVDWIATDLALQRLGAVSVPTHASLTSASLEELARRSGAVLRIADAAFERLPGDSAGVEVDPDLATLVFTSGTSGQPRGVMLTRANLVANALALSHAVGGDRNELRLSLLPFSHMYARTCDLYAWLLRGSRLVIGSGRESVFSDLAIVRPTAINAVPYFYQKCIEITEIDSVFEGQRLRAILGGEVTRCFCGGAAISPQAERAFDDAGIPLLVGYGLTEASPVVTASTASDYLPGAVGKPLPGVQVRLDADGEVLVHGPNVMLGYWNDPTGAAEVLQAGWLRTGDLGRWAEGGFLQIVGRKKEQIALATGKKVSPAKIEALLCASPWIEQAAVVGEGRNCLGALLVPNPNFAIRLFDGLQGLKLGSEPGPTPDLRAREAFALEIQRCLADCPAEEQVHAFELLGLNFSIDRGEVTEKLSLRRATIELNFSHEIKTMFRRLEVERKNSIGR